MNVATRTINCLSLCSGIGGLELGLSLVVPGFRVVCHVEREASAAALLVARMEDKSLDDAPIWDDLTTFDGAAWRGSVDIVTAGFPCQPWSVAGQQRGTEDERWIWSDIIRIIRDVRPGLVFLENVPGLLVHAGLGSVLGDLAEAGFDAEWGCVTAADVGASHRRERVFILAHANDRGYKEFGRPEVHSSLWDYRYENLRPEIEKSSREMANAGREHVNIQQWTEEREFETSGCIFPPAPNDLDEWTRMLAEMPSLKPAVCRMVDGLSNRVDRLRALGNAVVPLQVAYTFVALTTRISRITLPMQLDV